MVLVCRLGLNISESIHSALWNGLVAVRSIDNIDAGYEQLRQVLREDIRKSTEWVDRIYLKSEDELSVQEDYEALYVRTLDWFLQSVRSFLEEGYALPMFWEGVKLIGISLHSGEEVEKDEKEVVLFGYEIILDAIEFYLYSDSSPIEDDLEGGEKFSY